MYKIIILSVLFINLSANDESQSKIHFWNQTETASLENNFQKDKKIFQSNNIYKAVGVTVMEGLLNFDKITEKKKLNSNFKYLKEFENSITYN